MPDKRFIKNEVVCRQIAGETVLVPICRNVGDLESIYTLNPTASRIWEMLDGASTLAEIAVSLQEEFDAPAERVKADLGKIVGEFGELGLIKEA